VYPVAGGQPRRSPTPGAGLTSAAIIQILKDMIRDLDGATLAAVHQLGSDAYGVAIRTRVGELLGGRPPSIGTIHLSLTRLERSGFLRARFGDPTPVRGGRAKRLFALTAAGARALAQARHELGGRARAFAPNWRPS
jgi:DNA-binding PadR family transcriptional regulator